MPDNNVFAQHLLERGQPKGSTGRIALPVAGDDSKAKALVLRLVDQLGFDGIDAGGLDESWRQQPGSPAYGRDFDSERGSAGALRGGEGTCSGVARHRPSATPPLLPEWSAWARRSIAHYIGMFGREIVRSSRSGRTKWVSRQLQGLPRDCIRS
jgi:hypothetical protein